MKLSQRPMNEQFLILKERYRALKAEVRHLRQENETLRRTTTAPPSMAGLDMNKAMELLFREEPLADGQDHEWLTPVSPWQTGEAE